MENTLSVSQFRTQLWKIPDTVGHSLRNVIRATLHPSTNWIIKSATPCDDAKWSLTVTFFLGLLRIDITNFVNFMRKFSSRPLTFLSVMLRRGLEIRQ